MNIEINLLPEELRPRPPVETGTLLIIVLIVALAAGCGFLIMAKSSTASETESMRERIVAINQEAAAIQNNPEAVALAKSISSLKTAKGAYATFLNGRVEWGDALERVMNNAPTGVEVTTLNQSGGTLVVAGTASGYGAVTSYGRALDRDAVRGLAGMPSLTGSTYSLTVNVTPGGGG